MDLSVKFNINLSYTKDENCNNIIDIIYNDGGIKDILFYSINSRKYSVFKKNKLKINVNIDQQIFEIYSNDIKFIGYFYVKQHIDQHENTNIPYYLKQSDYLYLSPIFKSLKDLVNDNIDEDFIKSFSHNINVKYRLSNMYLSNNNIKLIDIGIHKLNTSNLGINVININDMNKCLFEMVFKDQNIQNNLTYQDIEKAVYLDIEGFLVTELSNSFSEKNGFVLLGNIIDKKHINDLIDAYLNDTFTLEYYSLKKSINDSIWFNDKIFLHKPKYEITLQNYSL